MDQLGEWLHTHADGIYGTRGGPYYPYDEGVSTHKGDRAWLYVTDPDATELTLAQLAPLQQAKVFGTDQSVPYQKNDDETLTFDLNGVNYDGPITVIELYYEEGVAMEAKQAETSTAEHD